MGRKQNSKGFKATRGGYTLHIDPADGDIPVTAIPASASWHDRQAALPLMPLSSRRVAYRHDLADAACCSPLVRDEARAPDHVPPIDHPPRRGEKIECAPHEAERYPARRQAERVDSPLKDHDGGRQVRVRGHARGYARLMVGLPVIRAEQILRMLNEGSIVPRKGRRRWRRGAFVRKQGKP